MDAATLRAIERIVATICGGLSIYLGYRLFQSGGSGRGASSARFALGEKASIDLSKVGPGVFFALFGAAVVTMSLWRGIVTGPAAGLKGEYYSGFRSANPAETDDAVDEQELAAARGRIGENIAVLNRLSIVLNPDLAPDQKADIELAIPEIKLALMNSVWDQQWGDRVLFADWVSRGGLGEPPAGLEKALEYYRQGQPLPSS